MIKSDNYITSEIRDAAEKEAVATLIGQFSENMFVKLMQKMKSGYHGWDVKDSEAVEKLKNQLANNVNQGDWIDVANISMFLWNMQQPDEHDKMPEVQVSNIPVP